MQAVMLESTVSAVSNTVGFKAFFSSTSSLQRKSAHNYTYHLKVAI